MRTAFGYLGVVFGWGWFAFQIPSLAAQTRQWAGIFASIHESLLTCAEWLAARLPDFPPGIEAAGFWEAAMAPFLFWPHWIFLIGLAVAMSLLGVVLCTFSFWTTRSRQVVEVVASGLGAAWLGYSFIGPNQILRATFPAADLPGILAPIFHTISLTPDPTVALYLTYVYALGAALALTAATVVLVVAWRIHARDAESVGKDPTRMPSPN